MLKTSSVIGYFGMVGGLAGLLITGNLFSPHPLPICLQAGALLLFFLARVTFGRRSYHVSADPTEGGLVTVGPYRHIRHPIYTAMCLFTASGAAAHRSWSAGLCLGLILASAALRIFCEEKLVAARYPGYAEYKARTWRMIPYVY